MASEQVEAMAAFLKAAKKLQACVDRDSQLAKFAKRPVAFAKKDGSLRYGYAPLGGHRRQAEAEVEGRKAELVAPKPVAPEAPDIVGDAVAKTEGLNVANLGLDIPKAPPVPKATPPAPASEPAPPEQVQPTAATPPEAPAFVREPHHEAVAKLGPNALEKIDAVAATLEPLASTDPAAARKLTALERMASAAGRPAKTPSPFPPDKKVMSQPHPEQPPKPIVRPEDRYENGGRPKPPKEQRLLVMPLDEALATALQDVQQEIDSVSHPQDKERYQYDADRLRKAAESGDEARFVKLLANSVGHKTFDRIVQSAPKTPAFEQRPQTPPLAGGNDSLAAQIESVPGPSLLGFAGPARLGHYVESLGIPMDPDGYHDQHALHEAIKRWAGRPGSKNWHKLAALTTQPIRPTAEVYGSDGDAKPSPIQVSAETRIGSHRTPAQQQASAALQQQASQAIAAGVPPELHAAYQANFQKVSDAIPEQAHKNIASHGAKFHFKGSLDAIGESLMTDHGPNIARAAQKTLDQGRRFGGAIVTRSDGSLTMVVDGGHDAHDGTGKKPPRDVAGRYYGHELAHLAELSDGVRLSDSTEWQQIHANSFADGQLTDYASTSPMESLAEFLSVCWSSKSGGGEFKEWHPQAWGFCVKHGLLADTEEPPSGRIADAKDVFDVKAPLDARGGHGDLVLAKGEAAKIDGIFEPQEVEVTQNDSHEFITASEPIGSAMFGFEAQKEFFFNPGQPRRKNSWDVKFARLSMSEDGEVDDEEYDQIRDGTSPYQTFSFVMNSLRQFIDAKKPDTITCRAKVSEKSRVDLYAALMRRAARKYGMVGKRRTHGLTEMFVLSKPEVAEADAAQAKAAWKQSFSPSHFTSEVEKTELGGIPSKAAAGGEDIVRLVTRSYYNPSTMLDDIPLHSWQSDNERGDWTDDKDAAIAEGRAFVEGKGGMLNVEMVDELAGMTEPAGGDQMAITMSASTDKIPGLKRLGQLVASGDESAAKALSQIAIRHLEDLTAGLPTVKITGAPAMGYYGGSWEASAGVEMTFQAQDEKGALAAVAKFADSLEQEQVHVRKDPDPGTLAGYDGYGDGSYNTPSYRLYPKTPLDQREIERLTAESGLYGVTNRGEYIEVYYVRQTAGRPEEERAGAEAFEQGVDRFRKALAGNLGESRRQVSRIWNYGQGGGAIPYGRISGDVHPEKASVSGVAREVASFLAGTRLQGAAVDDASPSQDAIHEKIAADYEAMPLSSLHKPATRKAYTELADEVGKQFDYMPVRVEVWERDGEEPYSGSKAMWDDVRDNNHLYIYPTKDKNGKINFGSSDADYSDHPLVQDSGRVDVNGRPLLYNDLLRAVHDYYAHNLSAAQFGQRGEEAAWKNHMRMTLSPLARWALTSETRGQNSWVNRGPHGDWNRANPKNTIFAEQKTGLLNPKWAMIGDATKDAELAAVAKEAGWKQDASGNWSEGGDRLDGMTEPASSGRYAPRIRATEKAQYSKALEIKDAPLRVSTITPRGAKETRRPHENGNLRVDLETMRATDPELYAQNAAIVQTYAIYPKSLKTKNPERATRAFMEITKANLLLLHDAMPASVRERAKLWYDGGRRIVEDWSVRYGVTRPQAAGILAALSPQMDWHKNVSLAQRLIETLTDADTLRFDPTMKRIVESLLSGVSPTTGKPNAISEETKAAYLAIIGKSYRELTAADHKAAWIIAHDMANRSPSFAIVSPEGRMGVNQRNKAKDDGSPGAESKITWNPVNVLVKAISIFENGDIANISGNLGDSHKVRNFFNNILLPDNEDGDITCDTHQVAASHMSPFSGSSPEVERNLDSSRKSSGMGGTYAIYADAHRELAAKLNLFPRELQSITWEAVRGAFRPEEKRDKEKKAASQLYWREFQNGKRSIESTQRAIIDLFGGIRLPDWHTT
jgi:hypothetical protein